MRRIVLITLTLGFLLSSHLSRAQVDFFPTEPEEFLPKFTGFLKQERNTRASEAAEKLLLMWNGGQLTAPEQEIFIQLANQMVRNRLDADPAMSQMTLLLYQLKNDQTKVKIPVDAFLEVTGQCIANLDPKSCENYLQSLFLYLPSGRPVSKARYHWEITSPNPVLSFETRETLDGPKSAPVLTFSETNLRYQTSRFNDSTLITGVSGKYFPVTKSFEASGGRVTWAKMGLDPAQVYCDLEDYNLNFNVGLVKADTATFYYEGLLSESIRGRFEDRNIGYENISKANYPYFQSYEGGIVIENLVPGVVYEGGFSLRGTRKIGSAYDVYEAPETPEEGESGTGIIYDDPFDPFGTGASSSSDWGDSDWESAEDEFSTFGSSDTDFESEEYTGMDPFALPPAGSEMGGLYGMALRHVPAKLEIKRADTTVIKLTGEAFVLDEEKMIGRNLMAVIYQGSDQQDSIYHPGMDLAYTGVDTVLRLKRSGRGNSRAIPFISSYHEFFLFFETIVWDLTEQELRFTSLIDRENKISTIESFDYFTMERYRRLQGILPFNPVGAIYRYKVVEKAPTMFPKDILQSYRLESDETTDMFRRILPSLEGSGFLSYDRDTYEITPTEKLDNWARAARKAKDFDAIQLISQVDTGANAILNMETMDMELRGVPFFSLSDSVFLRVRPSEGRVLVQEGRNLQFGGDMAVGRVNFYSSNEDHPSFTFYYDTYQIYCDSVDSMRFVLTRGASRTDSLTPLEKALSNTVFEGVTGVIHIDDPRNKSGEKGGLNSRNEAEEAYYAQFPVFDSYSQSYLYWDDPSIQGGVYDRSSMYFAISPFVLDSLENFDEARLNFGGKFVSKGIFPEFDQNLQVMDDNTLGFSKETPPDGIRIYEGKGRFFSEVTLDHAGLKGDGRIEYLGTVAQSDSFNFYFDSVTANVSYFSLKRGYQGGVYFPSVEANSAYYSWYTQEDALSLQSTSYEELSMFDGQGTFNGILSISKKGMVGRGDLTMGQIKIHSDSIFFDRNIYGEDVVTAPRGDFIVMDEVGGTDSVLFIAENVDIEYNIAEHTSTFAQVDSGGLGEFPKQQYATTFASGSFDRSKNQLDLEGSGGRDYFISTDPQMDNLKFFGEDAYFDLDSQQVRISGVPNIYVADAIITPDSQKVVIENDGRLQDLKKAVVEADQETRMHRIYEADVQILSRNDYEGSGKYDYIEVNGRPQYIQFDNIRINSDTVTTASGMIAEEDNFYLTERILFKGRTELDATNRFLTFEGEVKIESENPVFKGAWFTFEESMVNPDSVFIPIADDLTNEMGEDLIVGLAFVPEARLFYSNFLQAKEDPDDREVLTASGGLTFDRQRKEFRIGSEDKLLRRVYRGATVAFNDSANTITSQGLLNFPTDFEDKTIGMRASGSWKETVGRNDLSTDLLIGFDFGGLIDKDAIEGFMSKAPYVMAAARDIDMSQRSLQEAASELLDEDRSSERQTQEFVEQVRTEMVSSGIKLSEQLGFDLTLSGVNFQFNEDYRALFCDSKVGFVGLGDAAINKTVESKIVYQFGTISSDYEKQPDRVTILLELDASSYNWIFFHYEDEVLYTLSSFVEEYNVPIQEAIDKAKDTSGMRIELATEDMLAKFRQEFIVKFIR